MVRQGLVAALLGLVCVTACSSNGGSPLAARSGGSLGALPHARPASGSIGKYISHVVVIIQENRSFENFFAGYPGANAPLSGCGIPVGNSSPRVDAQIRRGAGSGSKCPPGDISIALKPITFHGPVLAHNWRAAREEYDKGKLDGFSKYGTPGDYDAYSYVEQSEVQPYWTMANQYVLADAMFPTEWGGSFTGHLTLVAGNDRIKGKPSESEVDFPNGLHDDCDSPVGTRSSYVTMDHLEHFYQAPFPCFDQFNSIANILDQAGIGWKIYATKRVGAGMWEPFEAFKYTRYGPDWSTHVIAPQTTVLNDPSKGNLASVSWVTPSKKDSDHPGDHSALGPSWVSSVVNAVGESSYWNSSAIIVVWDDWGGWFDNASPPQLDYRGLGFRVPCLIISPYAKQGYVDQTQYEYGSILKFIEEVYNLPNIGPASEMYTDARATGLDNAFDFTQKPRPFVKIKSKYPLAHFLHEPPSDEPVDTE
ncbi:MAG TPA: alkaline phosphatase family protein [Candidatus Cybelea sp.]|jgi:phospholipase C|nr:alkaline phosphatase family protein [Candidatus Cybelea sp.]